MDCPPFKFTWKIDNFSKLTGTKCYSEIFYCRDTDWRVLIFPRGNGNSINKHLSVYLDDADSSSQTQTYGWSRYAEFRLSVVDQRDAKYTITRGSKHKFNARDSDWGFTSFISLSNFYDLSRGYIVNDTCIIEAEVEFLKVNEEEPSDSHKEAKKAKDEPSIDVNWANETAEGMMLVALKNLRDDQLSSQGFTAIMEVLEKSFISLGASQQLFEDTWRPWIDNILQFLKDLDRMEEALKMNSIEAALKESLMKINETCQLQELSNSSLASEGKLDEQVVADEDKLRLKKRCAALLSAKSTLDGLKAQKAKMEGQLEDLHAQVAERRKLLIEKKTEIRLRMQIHPTQQACSTP